jgi:hypothetical protein
MQQARLGPAGIISPLTQPCRAAAVIGSRRMNKSDCLIVRAAGRQLDELRSEASRIAKGKKVDWWVERTDKGACFCFESGEVKRRFMSFCENLGVQHHEGR